MLTFTTMLGMPSTSFAKANLGGRSSGRMGFGRDRAGGMGLAVECSSRPQKKATAHHRKTRPKKTHAWDVRRKGPTPYPPLPALPPEWTVVPGVQDGEQQPPGEEGETSSSSSST